MGQYSSTCNEDNIHYINNRTRIQSTLITQMCFVESHAQPNNRVEKIQHIFLLMQKRQEKKNK